MVTLMTVGNSDGQRRCDERCYNATGPECECCCNGLNHGKGLSTAQGNTQEFAYQMLEEYEKRTGKKVDWVQLDRSVIPEQTDLFK